MSFSSTRPLSRDRAWSCVIDEYCDARDWARLKAGRIFAGLGQLLFDFAGAALICPWIIEMGYRLFQAQLGEPVLQIRRLDVEMGWRFPSAELVMDFDHVREFVPAGESGRRRKIAGNVPPRLADLPKKEFGKQH